MTDAPSDPTSAILAVIDDHPRCRLWVAPPFDRLPVVPGRSPQGITVDDAEVHLHLAATTVELVGLAEELEGQLRSAIGADRALHVHIEVLERAEPAGEPA